MSTQKRFRRTINPDELLKGERTLLDMLVALHREFPDRDRISVDTIEALTGGHVAGTLGWLTSHGLLQRSDGEDGRPAYSVTVLGLQRSREPAGFQVRL